MSKSTPTLPYRRCPNCDARSTRQVVEWRDFHTDRRWSQADPDLRLLLGECTECGMVYVTNSDEVDMTNTKYIHHRPPKDPAPVPPRSRRLDYHRAQVAMLSRYLKPGARVLDYGAGYCRFLTAAREFGYQVEGVNPVLHAAEWADRALGIKVHAVFGVDFEPKRKFDLVASDQTFEHLVNPRDDFRKVHEILADDGIAYVEVPNWRTIKRLRHGLDCQKDPMHYNYFTPDTLADMARRTGFRVLKKAPVVGRNLAARLYKSVVNPLGVGTCSVLLAKQA
jgi:SAM-dependent methyltransferase